ncbi:MAG TPA: hypothetical protein VFO67_06845 [Gemmatimonadales bacterium]|nr:hypothetical protein [Gemmatimonadales bacterium]
MTRPASETRLPGRVLLLIARALFEEPVCSTVIDPAIADLQREVQDAQGGMQRARACLRGYLAFWTLVAMALFTLRGRRAGGGIMTLLLGRTGANGLVVFVVALLWASWPMFGRFIAAAVIGGTLLAIALRQWYTRHPSKVAPGRPLAALPDAQINLSSIPVGADIGGLLFVIGAAVTMLLGLPASRWFILGSLLCGSTLAVVVFAWRSTHPSEPVSSISLR